MDRGEVADLGKNHIQEAIIEAVAPMLEQHAINLKPPDPPRRVSWMMVMHHCNNWIVAGTVSVLFAIIVARAFYGFDPGFVMPFLIVLSLLLILLLRYVFGMRSFMMKAEQTSGVIKAARYYGWSMFMGYVGFARYLVIEYEYEIGGTKYFADWILEMSKTPIKPASIATGSRIWLLVDVENPAKTVPWMDFSMMP